MAVALGVAPRLARGREGPNVDAFLRAMRYLTILQAALIPALLAWSTPIVNLTLGAGYEESADVLRALTPFVFLSGIGTFVTLAVNYVGEARGACRWRSFGGAGGIGLNLMLLPPIGVVGAAIAMDVAFARVRARATSGSASKSIGRAARPDREQLRALPGDGGCRDAALLARSGPIRSRRWSGCWARSPGLAAFVAGLFADPGDLTLSEVRDLWHEVRSADPACSATA